MNRLLCPFALALVVTMTVAGASSPPIRPIATSLSFIRDVVSPAFMGRRLQSNAGNDFETVCEYVGGTPTENGRCQFCDLSGCCIIDLTTFQGACKACSADENGDTACTNFDCDIDVNVGGNVTCAGCNKYFQSNATSGEEICLQFTCDDKECTCQGANWKGNACQHCEARNDTFAFDCVNVDGPDTVSNSSPTVRSVAVVAVVVLASTLYM
mmetsp:Transcript_12044/g.26078  ORF Transcript_12044/g.26078 Transcript_12044/m.26078 type:complete len:212 (+) Transcript_12044:299-934(+)